VKYIGLKNFESLFGSLGKTIPSAFQYSLVNNLRWLIVFITVPVAIGLGLAVLLNREIRGDRFSKSASSCPRSYLLPWSP
jgi:multiple sugar transport system permease protein